MNKQQFCKVINELEINSEAIHFVDKAVTFLNPENRILGLSDRLVESVIKLLDNCSPDEWVDWWIHETDYGKKKDMVEITLNDVKMKIETPEQLYDLVYPTDELSDKIGKLKVDEWQDINTVPLDTYVLFYFHFEKDDDYSQVCIASFETNELFYYDTNGNDICNTPTHWKPLPAPPKELNE